MFLYIQVILTSQAHFVYFHTNKIQTHANVSLNIPKQLFSTCAIRSVNVVLDTNLGNFDTGQSGRLCLGEQIFHAFFSSGSLSSFESGPN